MFLKLQTYFAYEESSETKMDFADGSSFTFKCEKLHSERGVVAFKDRPLPVVQIRCVSETPRAGTVVWLQGGPFSTFDPDINAEQAAMLSLGYDILVPLYIGSGERDVSLSGGVVTPDMDDALQELGYFLKWAQKRDQRVILFGTSYGAFLAATMAPKLRAADRLVLHNPILRPLRAVLPGPGADTSKPMIIDGPVADLSAEEKTRLSTEALTGFFRQWLEKDLISVLRARPPRHLFVIYGDSDQRIGMERIGDLLKLATASPLVLKNSDHAGVNTLQDLQEFADGLRQ